MKLSKYILAGCIIAYSGFITAEGYIPLYCYDLSIAQKPTTETDLALKQCYSDCDKRFSQFNLMMGKLNHDCKQKCLDLYRKLLDMKAKTDVNE